MLDDARAFDPADPERVYRNCIETYRRLCVEPVPRNRAQDLMHEWNEVLSGRLEPTTQASYPPGQSRGMLTAFCAVGRRLRGAGMSTGAAMHRYTIDPSGFWRLYHPKPVPEGWEMLGTIRRASDRSMGALGRSPDGLYVQINGDDVRMLDQRAVTDALLRVKLPCLYELESSEAQSGDARVDSLVRRACRKRRTTMPVKQPAQNAMTNTTIEVNIWRPRQYVGAACDTIPGSIHSTR